MKKITTNINNINIETIEKELIDFLLINTEDIIHYHHNNRSTTTLYYFEDNIHKLSFLLTENKETIKQFKMLKFDEKKMPIKSLDLFDDYQIKNIQINNLLKKLQNNIAYFTYDFQGKTYSFLLARGTKAKNILKKVEEYKEKNISNIDKRKMFIN